jgi:hypothetical protein
LVPHVTLVGCGRSPSGVGFSVPKIGPDQGEKDRIMSFESSSGSGRAPAEPDARSVGGPLPCILARTRTAPDVTGAPSQIVR